MTQLNEARAEKMLAQARARASELGVNVCIAIVDAGAHLKSFLRMDGAILGAADVAQKKARAAVA